MGVSQASKASPPNPHPRQTPLSCVLGRSWGWEPLLPLCVALPTWGLSPLPLKKPRSFPVGGHSFLSPRQWHRCLCVLRAGPGGAGNLENCVFGSGRFPCSCHVFFDVSPLMWALEPFCTFWSPLFSSIFHFLKAWPLSFPVVSSDGCLTTCRPPLDISLPLCVAELSYPVPQAGGWDRRVSPELWRLAGGTEVSAGPGLRGRLSGEPGALALCLGGSRRPPLEHVSLSRFPRLTRKLVILS